MKLGNAKSGACEASVAGPATSAGAESPGVPRGGVDRHIEMRAVETLKPYKSNARRHSKQQLDQIARSIDRFGFLVPVLIDEVGQIIAGHGRVEAAKRLGLDQIPVLRITHLSVAERKAYALADNRLAELAGWDRKILAIELQRLRNLNFDIPLTGFRLTMLRSSVMGPTSLAVRIRLTNATMPQALMAPTSVAPVTYGCLASINSAAPTSTLAAPMAQSMPRSDAGKALRHNRQRLPGPARLSRKSRLIGQIKRRRNPQAANRRQGRPRDVE
jgi:hypothetical protein